MKEAAIYARVSSDKQEEQRTIESQVAELRRVCDGNGCSVVQVYLDDGVSGASLVRPALDRLRDDAARGLFEALYVLSPDRLARKYLYQAIVLEELKKNGIQVVFLNKPVTDKPEDQLLLGIQGVIAEYERALIIERVRRGKLHAARSGRIQTSTPLFGYRLVLKSKDAPQRYEVDEEQAEIVRLIFSQYLQHRSSNQVAMELLRRGIPSPKGRQYWRPCVINRMLRVEAYIGADHYNKTNGKGAWRPRSEWVQVKVPPIIDDETFRLAQAFLDEHNGGKRFRQYLLTGLIKCSTCGRRYIGCPGYRRARDGHQTFYYRCTGSRAYSPIPRVCSARMVHAERLERAIVGRLSLALLKPESLVRHVAKVALKVDRRREDQSAAMLTTERRSLIDKRKRLLDLYVEGVVPKVEYSERIQAIERRMEAVDNALQEYQQPPLELSVEAVRQATNSLVSRARGRLERLSSADLRQFLRLLIDEIIYDWDKNEAHIMGHLPLPIGHSTSMSQFTRAEMPGKRDNGLRFELLARC